MDTTKKCIPCQGGVPKLNSEEITQFLSKIDQDWMVEDDRLYKDFDFNNYDQAVNFANNVVKIANVEAHHPYIHINYKNVKIILFTHKINGLHENDFLMAAKIDKI
tara:strand:- start:1315 stop:1632 length:318 start_codon:yes stop_codon:yes gene_type:complete